MAYKDLHEEPFDESTICKLEIFEDYAEAWIPTFVMQSSPKIHIFDLFAGTGYDINGVPGSPIRLLQKIKTYIGHIFQKKVKISLYLNEFEPNKKEQKKFNLLRKACQEYLQENNEVGRAIEIKYFNENCEELFPKLINDIRNYPSLVYLDQNGIKFLANQYLQELEKTYQTDFLYFVSSSYFWRFGDSKEFKEHFDIDMSTAKKEPYRFIHRQVLEHLKSKLPGNTRLKLYPFSLKKGTNIHGIIFGASHPAAVCKFLNIAWKRNPLNGEATFDIDKDEIKNQLDLFAPSNKQLTKIEEFQSHFRKEILLRKIKNNLEAFTFTLDNGHIPQHATEEIKKMKSENIVFYTGHPKISYDSWRDNTVVEFNIKGK